MKKVCNVNDKFFWDKNTGIIREKAVYSKEQEQTKDIFSYKWDKKDTYSRGIVSEYYRAWLQEKYFANDMTIAKKIFFDNCVVLDAGCGAGMSIIALLGGEDRIIEKVHYIGVDISDAVEIAKENFAANGYDNNCEFVQCDLNNIPLKEKVDVIFSEGVLHHTDSTRQAILNLSTKLKKGGYFLFYVYAKKAPIREYTDDYIREYFKEKDNEETWNELIKLTKFGKMLGDLNITLNIEEEIPFLGIKAGEIDLQRFFYWYLFKCFYKPDYNIEEMNHINFDWYRPLNCHRQSPEEVKAWCEEAGLVIERMNVEDAGITVVAKKL